MQRAREANPKVEPLANWSDLVFARAPKPHRYQGIRFFLKHALPLPACLVLVFALFSWQRPEATTVLHYQAGKATRQVLLPDGTYLTLDAGTAVDYMERSEEHTSELQSLMRISYAVFCLKKK